AIPSHGFSQVLPDTGAGLETPPVEELCLRQSAFRCLPPEIETGTALFAKKVLCFPAPGSRSVSVPILEHCKEGTGHRKLAADVSQRMGRLRDAGPPLVLDVVIHLILDVGREPLKVNLALVVGGLAAQALQDVVEEDPVLEHVTLPGGLPLGATEQD